MSLHRHTCHLQFDMLPIPLYAGRVHQNYKPMPTLPTTDMYTAHTRVPYVIGATVKDVTKFNKILTSAKLKHAHTCTHTHIQYMFISERNSIP